MLLADDTEMYERNQRGLGSLGPEWLDLRRGLNRERIDEHGFTIGSATDETAHARLLAPLHVTHGGAVTAAMSRTSAWTGARASTGTRSSSSSTARPGYADEHDYDAWEALWTDDALYWVPAGGEERATRSGRCR